MKKEPRTFAQAIRHLQDVGFFAHIKLKPMVLAIRKAYGQVA